MEHAGNRVVSRIVDSPPNGAVVPYQSFYLVTSDLDDTWRGGLEDGLDPNHSASSLVAHFLRIDLARCSASSARPRNPSAAAVSSATGLGSSLFDDATTEAEAEVARSTSPCCGGSSAVETTQSRSQCVTHLAAHSVTAGSPLVIRRVSERQNPEYSSFSSTPTAVQRGGETRYSMLLGSTNTQIDRTVGTLPTTTGPHGAGTPSSPPTRPATRDSPRSPRFL